MAYRFAYTLVDIRGKVHLASGNLRDGWLWEIEGFKGFFHALFAFL